MPDPRSDPNAALWVFPMQFPVKIMGTHADNFAQQISTLVCKHAPDFDPATLELRASSKGKYIGVTATIQAVSREQLDALYQELTAHPLVKVVL